VRWKWSICSRVCLEMSADQEASPSSRSALNVLAARRRKARHYGLQALYQWHMADAPLVAIENEFLADYDFEHVDREHFERLLHGVPAELDTLELAIAPLLDRALDELDPVERTLLRMGAFELMHCADVPYKVVISEAVALASKFGATDGHKYINGVLDRMARRLRPLEAPGTGQPAAPARASRLALPRQVPITVRSAPSKTGAGGAAKTAGSRSGRASGPGARAEVSPDQKPARSRIKDKPPRK